MLQIEIPDVEIWDDAHGEFINVSGKTILLEHSLAAISKWESKWQKPFLSAKEKNTEEVMDYIQCMCITQNVDPLLYHGLTTENIRDINHYINSPMTATWFHEEEKGRNGSEQVTSELIYYWMLSLNIPFECENWHLNRLFTLIRICNVKNAPHKPKSMREIMSRNAALNAARKKQLNTKG